jgi:hypothetical protein
MRAGRQIGSRFSVKSLPPQRTFADDVQPNKEVNRGFGQRVCREFSTRDSWQQSRELKTRGTFKTGSRIVRMSLGPI